MRTDAYFRFPHAVGDDVAFVADDDVWLAPISGGQAFRVSAERVPVQSPRISPDGAMVAWTATQDGAAEVYVAAHDGSDSRRLTFWGHRRTVVRGWWSEREVLVLSSVGQADTHHVFAHAVPVDGSPSRQLPYGWASDLTFGQTGAVLLVTSHFTEPAWWKRYRGGTAAQLWLDAAGSGEFKRLFADLRSSLVSPMWIATVGGKERIAFLSDHEGSGQLYSAPLGKRAPTTAQLLRHTDHDFYVRHATSAGTAVVYSSAGSLWTLASLDPGAEPRRIDVRLGGRRPGRQTVASTAPPIAVARPDRTGRASIVEARGTIHWLTHRDGPARSLATGSRVRRRLPVVLGETGRVAWITDVDGDDAIEVADVESTMGGSRLLVAAGQVGGVREMAASPDGTCIAVASHDGRLLVADVPRGENARRVRPRLIAQTKNGDINGLAFSPDSRWLAWSHPGPEPLRQICLTEVARRGSPVIDVTPLRFSDTDPVFTLDGAHLAFLSIRSFDPVYDIFVFDLSFPNGCRPYLVPLAATTPSPFDPMPGGRDARAKSAGGADAATGEQAGANAQIPPTLVDTDGLASRIVAAPVEAVRYARMQAVAGGLVWLRVPLAGILGDDRPRLDDEAHRATVERIDLATGKVDVLVDAADNVIASGDGSRLVVFDHGALIVVPSDRKIDPDDPDRIDVDRSRIRFEITPEHEWTQMFDEAWRLMRDNYWRPDMGGTDWDSVRSRYRPLVAKIGSHDELIDILWEMHGELGSSHAYAFAPDASPDPARRQGQLGADVQFVDGAWRVRRIVPGESAEPRARSPLLAPGVAIRDGDAIVAVDGRPTGPSVAPGSLLVGTAGKPVELLVAPAAGGEQRRVVVVPLADEGSAPVSGLGRGPAGVREGTHGRPGGLPAPARHAVRRLGAASPRSAYRDDVRRAHRRCPCQPRWPHVATRGGEVGATNCWLGDSSRLGTAVVSW